MVSFGGGVSLILGLLRNCCVVLSRLNLLLKATKIQLVGFKIRKHFCFLELLSV